MNREEILSKVKTPATLEAVEAGDMGTLYVKQLKGKQYVDYIIQLSQRGEGDGAVSHNAVLLSQCLCDASGTRLFTDDDAVALDEMDGTNFVKLVTVAFRLNNTSEAVAEKK